MRSCSPWFSLFLGGLRVGVVVLVLGLFRCVAVDLAVGFGARRRCLLLPLFSEGDPGRTGSSSDFPEGGKATPGHFEPLCLRLVSALGVFSDLVLFVREGLRPFVGKVRGIVSAPPGLVMSSSF